MPDDKDPFSFQTLKAKRFLAKARPIVQSVPLPMGFDSGRAVGEMMKLLDVPVNRVIQVVWAIVNDYKVSHYR